MNDITKLPKWAQEHIQTIQYQRDAAIRTLNDFTNQQTPTSVYFEEHPCTGESQGPTLKRRYLQTHAITFLLGKEEISLRFDHEGKLFLSAGWHGIHFKPTASNQIQIVEEKR